MTCWSFILLFYCLSGRLSYESRYREEAAGAKKSYYWQSSLYLHNSEVLNFRLSFHLWWFKSKIEINIRNLNCDFIWVLVSMCMLSAFNLRDMKSALLTYLTAVCACVLTTHWRRLVDFNEVSKHQLKLIYFVSSTLLKSSYIMEF